MKNSEITTLERGDWVLLRDGRKCRFQEELTCPGYSNVIVNTPNKDGVGCNIHIWPNQVVGKTTK